MGKAKDITGQVFGELTVIKRAGTDKHGQAKWECICSCGSIYIGVGAVLRSGNTKSCGHGPTHCPQGHEYAKDNLRMYKGARVCRACSLSRSKAVYERNKKEGVVPPSHTPEAKKDASLKTLGWTLDLFNKVLVEQSSKCAICEKEVNLSKVQNSSRACADHLHVDPPVPRGILCTICNAMIGHALENPSILRAAALYIEKFSLETPAEATKLTVSAKTVGM